MELLPSKIYHYKIFRYFETQDLYLFSRTSKFCYSLIKKFMVLMEAYGEKIHNTNTPKKFIENLVSKLSTTSGFKKPEIHLYEYAYSYIHFKRSLIHKLESKLVDPISLSIDENFIKEINELVRTGYMKLYESKEDFSFTIPPFFILRFFEAECIKDVPSTLSEEIIKEDAVSFYHIALYYRRYELAKRLIPDLECEELNENSTDEDLANFFIKISQGNPHSLAIHFLICAVLYHDIIMNHIITKGNYFSLCRDYRISVFKNLIKFGRISVAKLLYEPDIRSTYHLIKNFKEKRDIDIYEYICGNNWTYVGMTTSTEKGCANYIRHYSPKIPFVQFGAFFTAVYRCDDVDTYNAFIESGRIDEKIHKSVVDNIFTMKSKNLMAHIMRTGYKFKEMKGFRIPEGWDIFCQEFVIANTLGNNLMIYLLKKCKSIKNHEHLYSFLHFGLINGFFEIKDIKKHISSSL